MITSMPVDVNNNPVPALRLRSGKAHTISAGASAAKNASAFADDTQIVSVYASVPVYIAFGDSSVSASSSDHYFPAGVYYDFAIGNEHSGHQTYLSVLQVSSAGTVYVSEKY